MLALGGEVNSTSATVASKQSCITSPSAQTKCPVTTWALRRYQGDTIANSLGDILSCGCGVVLARRLRFWRSLTLFVVTELILLLWIRDSLLLNVVMLICPIDAIKAWQLGYFFIPVLFQ